MTHAHEFFATTTWTGARSGPTSNYDSYSREYEVETAGKPTLVQSAATVFRGEGSLHNPEDLLVAALSGCHLLTYLALCAHRGIAVVSYRDECSGRMEVRDGVMRFVGATLNPVVEISVGDLALARSLHERAHGDCFIAASVNFPVRNQPTVTQVKINCHPE